LYEKYIKIKKWIDYYGFPSNNSNYEVEKSYSNRISRQKDFYNKRKLLDYQINKPEEINEWTWHVKRGNINEK
jgi:hypothetical protein